MSTETGSQQTEFGGGRGQMMASQPGSAKNGFGGGSIRLSVRRETLLVTLVYIAYALFLTWPLVTNLSGLLAGVGISGDTGGGVGELAYVVQHNIFPFAPAIFHGLNAPEGISQAWVLNVASLPSNVLLFGLGFIFGPVAGTNLFLIASFVLSGLSMFLLTRRLFQNSAAAALAGFVFAFYPFAVNKIDGHFQYMDGFVLVLAMWRMLELIDETTLRNALLAGAAAAFAMWWTPYFILIAGVGFVLMEVVLILLGAMRGRVGASIKAALVAVAPIVVLFGALGALTVVAGNATTGTVRTQALQELYTYSARWLEWLLPDRYNLIFGGLTGPYLTAHLHGSNFSESTLYLGISVIALAGVGAVLACRRSVFGRRVGSVDLGVIAALVGTLTALVAAWFSSPPKVDLFGVVLVPTPSDAIYQFTSTWRVYTRFVELIELGLCLPLAYAVARLLTHRDLVRNAAVFGGLAAVVVLDLWARPPVRTVSTTPPPEYAWLAKHPGGIVADYPLNPADYPNYSDLFWQMDYHHPLFQGYDAGTYDESMKLDFVDLREPRTAPALAALGVRYVVVHPGVSGGDPRNMRKQHYTLRFASADGSVWQVGAAPARTRVDALTNFSTVEGGPGTEYRWMTGTGVLGAFARGCMSCHGEVSFESNSNQFARTLTVRDQRTGVVLRRKEIPAGVTVPVVVPNVRLVHGVAHLVLSTNVGPTRPPNGDPRSLSIVVEEPRLTLARAAR